MPVLLLREWRTRRGLTLKELAARADVSYVTISRIETGRMSPTVATLEKLAKALGVGVRDFFPVGRRKVKRERRDK